MKCFKCGKENLTGRTKTRLHYECDRCGCGFVADIIKERNKITDKYIVM